MEFTEIRVTQDEIQRERDAAIDYSENGQD